MAGLLLGSPGAALAASLPDLKVTALTNPPSSALPGVSFAVTATIKNGGSAEAPASTTTFSLSKDKKTATKDLKGVQLVPALPATIGFTSVVTLAVAPGTPAGIYYLQACADGPAKIPEASESNNCKWSSEKITVFSLPDLVVTAISDPRRGAARTELQGQDHHREERRHGAFGGDDHDEVLPGVNVQRGAGGSGRRAIRSGPEPRARCSLTRRR